uniref:Glycine N-acyltransferase-like protein n=1 Tax=Otus sunia TaxID=257818 RepID=A0A8C8E4W3_9STRI
MLILTCPGHLRRLEEALRRSLPATLPVLGTVMTVARGNPASHEVLVDSWPHFSVVLTRLRPEVLRRVSAPHPGSTPHAMGLGEEGGARLNLSWMQEGLYQAVREAADAKGLRVETYRYQALLSPPHPNLSSLPRSRVPPGLRLAPVSPSHIPLLNATWAFGGNTRSRRFLLGVVQALPSACLLAPHGRPVSWSLLDPLGTLSHGYTLPAWRGRGLSGVTLGALGRVLHARGFPIYCGVLPHNTPSQRAVRAVGFLPQPGTFYTLVVTPPTQ